MGESTSYCPHSPGRDTVPPQGSSQEPRPHATPAAEGGAVRAGALGTIVPPLKGFASSSERALSSFRVYFKNLCVCCSWWSWLNSPSPAFSHTRYMTRPRYDCVWLSADRISRSRSAEPWHPKEKQDIINRYQRRDK